MTVYQLKMIPERFMAGQLDLLELAEQLGGEDLLMTLMNHPFSNESLQPYWKSKEVLECWGPLSPSSCEVPDVCLWGAGCLLLSAKAYDALHGALQHDGEFLPIVVDGEPMQIFNCRTFVKEDMTLSERKYLNGIDDGLQTLVFDEHELEGHQVFKSEKVGAVLYASQSFKDLVEANGLQGLRFDTDLLDPF